MASTKRQRTEGGLHLLQMPAVVLRSCVAKFATFDELLLDWPIVCKTMRDCAVPEKDRRSQLFRGLGNFLQTYTFEEDRAPPLEHVVAVLCLMHLDTRCVRVIVSSTAWACAIMAARGRPCRLAVAYGTADYACKSLGYVRGLIDEKKAASDYTPFEKPQLLVRGNFSLVPLVTQDEMDLFNDGILSPVKHCGADALLFSPWTDALLAVFFARQVPRLICEVGWRGGIIPEFFDPDSDPTHAKRCRSVWRYVLGLARVPCETAGQPLNLYGLGDLDADVD